MTRPSHTKRSHGWRAGILAAKLLALPAFVFAGMIALGPGFFMVVWVVLVIGLVGAMIWLESA